MGNIKVSKPLPIRVRCPLKRTSKFSHFSVFKRKHFDTTPIQC